MISKQLKFILVGLLIAAGSAGIVLLRLDNRRLRQRIAGARPQQEQTVWLREDNRHTQELLARAQAAEDDGAQVIHTEVARLRGEAADLEKHARVVRTQMLAQAAADTHALDYNRDPEKGLTRLEHFQNVGQATPAAAFQTFVWAAMNGEDIRLAAMITLPGAAREQAEAVVAALPEADRAIFSSPEKLAALFFANALTQTASAQVVGVSRPDGRQAVVTVRGLTDKEQKVPMILEAQGWQIVVQEVMVEKLQRWSRGGSKKPPR